MTTEAIAPDSDRLFRALIEHSPEIIVLLTPEGSILYASPSIERVLGYAPEEFIAVHGFAIIHPDDSASLANIFQHLLVNPGLTHTKQLRYRHKDGTWRWMEATITNLLHEPDVQAFMMNLHDTTERRTLEQELQFSELKLRSLVEANVLGVAVIGLDGRIYESNECFARIFGYSTDELLVETFNWSQLVPPESHKAFMQLIKPFLSPAALPPFEWKFLRKDGSLVPILAMAMPLDYERRHALAVTLDISDRKAAEQRKQQFLRMMNHELRTPLTAVLGLIELALRDIKRRPISLVPEAEELCGQIEQKLRLACGQVDIEIRLVGDLLEVSQLEMHQFTLSLHLENIVTIVQKTIASQQEAHSRDIELVLPPAEVVPVIVDADRIGQVLTNYLTNAFKFTPAEQVIVVQLEVEADRVLVEVRDKGPGLTLEQQRRVWEQFYQVSEPGYHGLERGLGLGLAIAKAIIEQHQGQVGVESVPGQGAAFWFTLPLAEELNLA